MSGLLSVSSEGARAMQASESFVRVGDALISALRRAVPCLGRKGADVTRAATIVRPTLAAVNELATPLHETHIVVQPNSLRGMIVFDAACVALLLDGVLGGGGANLPSLSGQRLSSAQTALMTRLAGGIAEAWSEVLKAKTGTTIAVAPRVAPSDSSAVVATFIVKVGEQTGTLLFAIPADAISTPEEDIAPTTPREVPKDDPRIASAMMDVELELVAELGRVRMSLGDVSRLHAGSTILAGSAVGGLIAVRADGHELFTGEPTKARGQLAVRIRDTLRG